MVITPIESTSNTITSVNPKCNRTRQIPKTQLEMTTTDDSIRRQNQVQPRVTIKNSRHKASTTQDRVGLVVGKLPTKTYGSPSNLHANPHTDVPIRKQERAEVVSEIAPSDRAQSGKVKEQEKPTTVGHVNRITTTNLTTGPMSKGEATIQTTTNETRKEGQPDQAANVITQNNTKQTQKSIKDYMKKGNKKVNKRLSRDANQPPVEPESDYENEANDKIGKSFGDLNIIQCNLQKKRQAMKMLGTNIIGHENPIVLMQEPYAQANKKIASIHKEMTIFQSLDEMPRAAIAIPKQMNDRAWKMDIGNDRDSCTVLIKNEKTSIILSSIYMDQKKPIKTSLLKELNERADKLNAKLVIGTDTNAHHSNWGDKKTDKRGETLIENLNVNNLQWINRGQKPTFVNSRGHNSIIDITVVNRNMTRDITEWRVSDEATNSDHRYIRFKIKKAKVKMRRRIERNTDWKKFKEELEKSPVIKELKTMEIRTYNELNLASYRLQKEIKRCWKIACPLTYSRDKPTKLMWQTTEVTNAKNRINKLLKKRKNRKNTIKIDRKLILANDEYEKVAGKAQKQAWLDFTGNVDGTQQAAKLNKILKLTGQANIQAGSIVNSDKTLATSPAEALKNLLDHHFGMDTPIYKVPTIKYSNQKGAKDSNTFEEDRIKRAINSLHPHKAPGPDGVTNGMLREGIEQLTTPIANIFKASHRLQTPPSNWTYAKGIFLPKPGKDCYQSAKSFRTITLSPTILKLYEKLVLWHLETKCNIYKNISTKQHGFKKGQSVITALHKCVHKIEKRLASKGMVLAMFLDIQGAFDNVSYKAIDDAMDKFNIDEPTKNWISNWLSNRKLTAEFAGESRTIRIKRGCPQGGVLSPILWLMVIDDVLKKGPKDIPALVNGFADDLCCLTEGNDIKVMKQRMQKTATYINKWCKSQGLTLSANKTVLVLFSRGMKAHNPTITVEGNKISTSDQAKLLGVTLDKKLNFGTHMENAIRKAKQVLGRTRAAVGKQWGITPKIAEWIYTAVVRPNLEYGIEITNTALQNKKIANKLRSVQGKALKMVTGALSTTATADLNILTDTIDIIEHLKVVAAKSITKLKNEGQWTKENTKHNGHTRIDENISRYIGQKQIDTTTPTLNLDTAFTTIIPDDSTEYKKAAEKEMRRDTPIQCYTDGSKNEKGETGSGIYITKEGKEIARKSYNLPDTATVFQAEVTAITEAVKTMTESKLNQEEINIWVDSQAAIKALNKTVVRHKTVKECIESLNILAGSNKVRVRWIKAHIGYEGNETADELAKRGTTTGDQRSCPIPMSHVTKILKERAKANTIQLFEINGGKHTKKMYADKENSIIGADGTYQIYKYKKQEPNTPKILQRAIRSSITQIITGHAPTNHYLHKIGKTSSNTCRLCEEEDETVEHIIIRCPAMQWKRHLNYEGTSYKDHITAVRSNWGKTVKIFKEFLKETKKLEQPE